VILIFNDIYDPIYAQEKSITIWVMYENNIKKALDEVIRLFRVDNSDITVKYIIIPWENAYDIFRNETKLKDEIQSNKNPPDIIQVPSTWASHFIHEGFLLELTNNQWIDRKLYFDDAWETCIDRDIVYALPWFIDVRVLYYRKDILKEIGCSKDDLITWESFENVCNKIKDRNIKLGIQVIPTTGEKVFLPSSNIKSEKNIMPLGIEAFSELGWNTIHNIIAPHYWSKRGGREIDINDAIEEGNVIVPPSFQEDVDFYIKLVTKYSLVDKKRSHDEIQDNFVNGLYAMYFFGPSLISKLKQKWGEQWTDYFGIAEIPQMKIGHFTFIGGGHLGIYRDSPSKSEALKFIKFLSTNQTAQLTYSTYISQIPALKNLRDKSNYNEAFLHVSTWKKYPHNKIWFIIEEKLPKKIVKESRTGLIERALKKVIKFLKKPIPSSRWAFLINTIVSFFIGMLLQDIIKRIKNRRKASVPDSS